MSKGSRRRPAAISDAELEDRWRRVFGGSGRIEEETFGPLEELESTLDEIDRCLQCGIPVDPPQVRCWACVQEYVKGLS